MNHKFPHEISCNRSIPPEVYCKKCVLKFSQNSQENTDVGVSFLIKFQAFFIEHLRWLLRGFLKTWRLLKNIFPENFLGKVPRKAFVIEA